MNNEWKEPRKDKLPEDILTGDYEFECLQTTGNWLNTGSGVSRIIDQMVNKGVVYRYRRREKPAPSHEDIMTKWWLTGGLWLRVANYEPREPRPYRLIGMSYAVNKEWFTDRESADIPPEAD